MYNISLMCKPDVMQKGLDNVNDVGATDCSVVPSGAHQVIYHFITTLAMKLANFFQRWYQG